jgi:hypothetical protein
MPYIQDLNKGNNYWGYYSIEQRKSGMSYMLPDVTGIDLTMF